MLLVQLLYAVALVLQRALREQNPYRETNHRS